MLPIIGPKRWKDPCDFTNFGEKKDVRTNLRGCQGTGDVVPRHSSHVLRTPTWNSYDMDFAEWPSKTSCELFELITLVLKVIRKLVQSLKLYAMSLNPYSKNSKISYKICVIINQYVYIYIYKYVQNTCDRHVAPKQQQDFIAGLDTPHWFLHLRCRWETFRELESYWYIRRCFHPIAECDDTCNNFWMCIRTIVVKHQNLQTVDIIGRYCWWFRHPANQLRLVVEIPLFSGF